MEGLDLVPEKFSQLSLRGFTQWYFGLVHIFQAQAKAVTGIGDDFFYLLQIDEVGTVGTEKAAA